MDFGLQVLDSKRSVFYDTGFVNLDSGFRKLKSRITQLQANFFWILGSKTYIFWDSGFQRVRFQIPKANIFWIPNFTSKNFLDSEIWITLNGAR